MNLNIILQKSKERQNTILREVEFKGISLLTGEPSSMILKAGKENSGIVFIQNNHQIPAVIECLKPTPMHTTILEKDGFRVFTTEHLLAAIWGLGIDNIEIILKSNTIPAQDASSEKFTKILKRAKIIKQGSYRKLILFQNKYSFKQAKYKNRIATIEPKNKSFEIEITAPWPEPIGEYTIKYRDNPENFEKEISWARTFLRSPISLKNCSKWEKVRSIYKALPKNPKDSPIITFTENKFITPLKRRDEPARHKVLDLIGDLALIGYRARGKLTINEPGHKFTYQIVKKIRKAAFKIENEST